MWTRRLASWTLSLAVLCASTAGLAGHDHGAEVERGGYDCAIDHERPHDAAASAGSASPTPELRASGEQHRHQCLGCHYHGHRFQLTPFLQAAGPSPGTDAPFEVRQTPRVSIPWTGRTLRGPPAA